MRRYSDWLRRLGSAIKAGESRPFSWGGESGWDCCCAPASLVAAITIEAVDLIAPFRGRYTTKAGATLAMRRYVGQRLEHDALLPAVATRRGQELGLEEVPALRAQRGDVVLALAPTIDGIRPVLAVVGTAGTHALTASEHGGWAEIPMTSWRRGWRV